MGSAHYYAKMGHPDTYIGVELGGQPYTWGGAGISFRPPTFAMELISNFEVYANVFR